MENNNEKIEITETPGPVEENKKKFDIKEIFSKIKSFFSKFKSDKIKNEALFKRGGYSLAITALVLAGLILFNWLVSSLADRFNLEFDMTSDKKNSISQENIDFIEGISNEVSITICGTEENYADYMQYYAQNHHGVQVGSFTEFQYFTQTVTLIEKYPSYNDKITVKYIDPQSTEFTGITSKYSNYELAYGDMIVTSTVNGKERNKVLGFDDIYLVEADDTYASYGYTTYTLNGNRIETALTSAIAYVTSADTKKVAVLSGHSNNNFTDAYIQLLETNNYEVTNITDKLITSISSDYDAVIISAPSIDFIGSELDIISEFLENDGKLGKGMIFFADATCPALPNLYSFLSQWGINVQEGIVYETDSNNHLQGSPSTIVLEPVEVEEDDITSSILSSVAITNYNVPMKAGDASTYERTATALLKTCPTTVIAPVGASADWSDYKSTDIQQFDSVIQSVESDFDANNNPIESYVMAFSSVEFVQSTWASYSDLCNQDIVISCTDRAAHVGDTSMTFTSKFIKDESFASKITEKNIKVVNTIFMFIIPIAVIVLGIVIFIRRRNAR